MTLAASGDLDPASRFFTTGDVAKIVYATSSAVDKSTENVGTVGDAGDPVDPIGSLPT